MLIQVTETLKEVGEISKSQGWQTALVIFAFVGFAFFSAWLVRYLLNANEKARSDFLAALEKLDERHEKRNTDNRAMLERFGDELRRR